MIGTITTPHGVRGTLRVKPSGSGNHIREGVCPLAGERRLRVIYSRQTPKGFLVDFEGIGSREAANAMRGTELILDRRELDEPEEGEVYVADLVGLDAFDESGEKIGVVAETFETAAHEVLIIRNDGGEVYVPFTTVHVPALDLAAGGITVRPPEE